MLRKILIGSAIFMAVVVASAAFLYHKASRTFEEIEAAQAEGQKLLQPRIVLGERAFARRPFYEAEGVGNISEMRVGWPADREGASIAVVGGEGVDFLDGTAKLEKQVRFEVQQFGPVTVARLNSAGEYGYLTRDQSWSAPATFFDKDGHVSWRSNGSWPGVNDSVSGDVYGDGQLSVAVGFNGHGGVELLDSQGKRMWKKDEQNVWHMEMLDTNGDGRDEILHSDAAGKLLVRSGQGDVIARYVPDSYVSWFSLTRWEEESRPTHILVPTTVNRAGCCKPIFLVLDAGGKTVAERESPLGNLMNEFEAVPLHLGKDGNYFAIVGSNRSRERSILLIYDRDGKIVYQEILDATCPSITTLQEKKDERLLIGCTNKIWEYFPVVGGENGVHSKLAKAVE